MRSSVCIKVKTIMSLHSGNRKQYFSCFFIKAGIEIHSSFIQFDIISKNILLSLFLQLHFYLENDEKKSVLISIVLY